MKSRLARQQQRAGAVLDHQIENVALRQAAGGGDHQGAAVGLAQHAGEGAAGAEPGSLPTPPATVEG